MSFYKQGEINYTAGELQALAVESAEIREMLRAHDSNAFQMITDFARRELMPISSTPANSLINSARYYSRSLNYDAMISDLEEYCGMIFKIMVENIQERKRREQNGTF